MIAVLKNAKKGSMFLWPISGLVYPPALSSSFILRWKIQWAKYMYMPRYLHVKISNLILITVICWHKLQPKVFWFLVCNYKGENAWLHCFTCCDTRICSWTAINVECSRAENPADKYNKTGWCTLMGLLCCRHGEHGLVRCDLL